MYRSLLLALSLLFIITTTKAAVFVVTSNADSGLGTLREALTLAAANGSAEKDYINFNLPDLSETGRTITILTDLPELSSNLIIDGSTQPGEKIGVSDAKITLKTYRSTQKLILFKGSGLKQVEFYGFYFFDTTDPCISDPDGAEKIGIQITNSEDIIFGAFGKGNIDNGYKNNFIDFDNVKRVTIAGNIFGQFPKLLEPVCSGFISLTNAIDVTLGNAAAGNTFFSGIEIRVADGDQPNTITVTNNNFAVATDGVTVIHYISGNHLTILSNATDPSSPKPKPKITLNISDNLFSHYGESFGGLIISSIAGAVNIKHNWFGTDRAETLALNLKQAHPGDGTCIYLENITGDVVVGDADPALGNKFAYSTTGISANGCQNVKVIRNSFKCISSKEFTTNSSIPQIAVNSTTTQYIQGTSTPKALVDLFVSDDCVNCSPQTYIGSTNSDENGNWKYTFTKQYTNSIIANAHVGKQSSDFTKPQINLSNLQVMGVDCGHGGKISGVTVINTETFKWVDDQGNIVSTELELKDAKPGRYKLIVGKYCTVESDFISLDDLSPHIYDDSKNIINPSCNESNGSISNLFAYTLNNQSLTYLWTDQNQKDAGHSINVTGLPPGKYTLKVTSTSGCSAYYGPISLASAASPKIDDSKPAITNTTCAQSTGSIKNIIITGGTGTRHFTWKNEQQQEVAYTQDLTGQPAGKYTLQVTDDTQCGPVYSKEIEIAEVNGITLTESTTPTTPASCGKANGAVSGVTATGGVKYEWRDVNGNVVGNNIDLTGVPGGGYQLTVSNAFCQKQSKVYQVLEQSGTVFPSTYTVNHIDACYGVPDGALQVNQDVLIKAVRWVNSAGVDVGMHNGITGLPVGSYKLYLTDQNGCESYYNTYQVAQLPEYTVADRGQINDETCGLKNGYVHNATITGGLPPYTYKWLNANGEQIGSTNSISNLAAGDYTLNVVDSRCGDVYIPYTIQNIPQDLPTPSVSDLQVCSPGDALFFVNSPVSNGTYRLYDQLNSPSPLAEQAGGSFKIGVTSNRSFFVSQVNGTCESARSEVKVSVGLSAINIANTFSPNGDGHNDYWKIDGIESYPQAVVQIFNRNGQKLFESKGYGTPFNGTYKGKPLPTGTYFYIINLNKNCNLLSGSLTIIR
ncbi:gliding motility-associated C-terminal domain-containing protein [Mucilaginibacter dorajii]|uniref:Ig-like domain-containing protein n=1 Tax=Mucilaginibacter dorajii TaxID=692994 RepID=A0ABP7PNN5_9SPHI|nr:gliding motility-associated C-terminal domain-containing protein [Mucilaginibacter dorajii]MCS3736372.1 gliding motility-associated-like protein [Mucilaginibacter dorajii]